MHKNKFDALQGHFTRWQSLYLVLAEGERKIYPLPLFEKGAYVVRPCKELGMISLFFISAMAFAKPLQNKPITSTGFFQRSQQIEQSAKKPKKQTSWTIRSTQADSSIHIPLAQKPHNTSMTVRFRKEQGNNIFTFLANGPIQNALVKFYRSNQSNDSVNDLYRQATTTLQFNQEYGWQQQDLVVPNNVSLSQLELTVKSGMAHDKTSIISISDLQSVIEPS